MFQQIIRTLYSNSLPYRHIHILELSLEYTTCLFS